MQLINSLFLFVLLCILPSIVSAEYETVDDLTKAHEVGKCRACHERAHEEWRSSAHSRAVVQAVEGMRNFIVVGLGKEWNAPVTREHLMRCMVCHAPLLKDASESAIKEVARLIVTAADEKDEAKRVATEKALSTFGVNCIVCHNEKISVERNLQGEPKPGVLYGPAGRPSPAHGTEKSKALSSALFCGQCHGVYFPPDGDLLMCVTLYGSYQDAYRESGGAETCQDCHMKKHNRGHTFPGSHSADMIREGIGLDVQTAGVKLSPGKWTPTAVINIGLTNRAGHRIPDG